MLFNRANVLLFGAISLGAGVGQPLFAQSTPAVGTELEEIIVTAEKRETSLQKTAVAVTAVQGQDLAAQGQSAFSDVLRTVPSVAVRDQNGAAQPTVAIRGIQQAFGTDTSININIDNVYQASGVMPIYDLARVEVLKGPQGTLYGRNALGGVVNMITNAPSDEFGGRVQLQYGNYNATRIEAAINLPFSQNILSRTATVYSRHDGYISNGSMDEDVRAVREKLRFNFTEDFSALLTGEYVRIGGHGAGNVPAPLSGYTSYSSPSPFPNFATPGPVPVYLSAGAAGVLTIPRPSDPWYSEVRPGAQDFKKSFASLELDWNQPWSNILFLASYSDLHTINDNNVQSLFQTNANPPTTWLPQINATGEGKSYNSSYELRFANPADSRLIWQTGLYYSRQSSPAIVFPAVLLPLEQHISSTPPTTASGTVSSTTTSAAFAQVTFPVTDAFRVTGGVRYTKEELVRDLTVYNVTYTSLFTATGTINSVSTTAPPRHDTGDDSAWTGKLGVEFDLGPDSLLYADYSRGFKAGGLNSPDVPASVAPSTFAPEYLDAFEIGSKNEFLNKTLRLNADAFYYKNKDKQYTQTGACNPVALYGARCPIPQTPVVNASRASSYGLELQSVWLATSNDEISAVVSWNHTQFDVFMQSAPNGYLVGTFVDPVTGHTTPIVPCPSNPAFNCFDRSGDQLPNAPEWTGTLSYQHTFRMSSGNFSVGGNAQLVSGTDSDANIANSNGLDQYQPAYQMYGARLEYAPADAKWTLGAYGNNLSNEAVRQRSFVGNRVWLMAPRTYGVTLNVQF